MKNVLSINGGGIRGIIPCTVLASLEAQSGKLIRDLFSYVSGTSTGALLAAGIAAGVPCSELLTVYTTQSKKVFNTSGLLADAKLIEDGWMYDPKNLRDVLNNVYGKAASWKMNDCPIGICIPATAANGHNWFFVRDNAKNGATTGSTMLVDAAVASACAPTYFNHWDISVQGKRISFFDGGTGCLANPSYQTCVEMFEFDSFTPADTRMICLGTGYYPNGDAPPVGLLATIEFATDTLVDTSEDWVDQATARQWPGVPHKSDWLMPSAIAMNDLNSVPALLALGKTAAAAMDWSAILSG